MIALINRTDKVGLLGNCAAAVLAAIILNGIIAIAGWANYAESGSGSQESSLPPDWVVGAVWVVLFALMGASRWFVIRSAAQARSLSFAVFGFMAWCLAYPVFTDGLRSVPLGLLGNGITLGLNAAVCISLLRESRVAAALMSLPAAWVTFASIALLRLP